MGYNDLQCFLIGKPSNSYKKLVRLLAGLLSERESNIYAKYISADNLSIKNALKKQKYATLVFISDEIAFSIAKLSDLVWQNSPDAIIVIITEKTATTAPKSPFYNTQISKLNISNTVNSQGGDKAQAKLYLDFLIQTVQIKKNFRRCKIFLNVAEQRCQWLVASSHQAVAFITRDLHLYANNSYLKLFDIDSIHQLPSIPIRELVASSEIKLFEGFIASQIRNPKSKNALILSMTKVSGKGFRANMHIIPAVFKGHKCLQLWIEPLTRSESNQQEKKGKKEKIEELLIKDTNAVEIINKAPVTEVTMLRSILKRKEAIISAQRLVGMASKKGSGKIDHLILSLKVPTSQRKGTNDVLFNLKKDDKRMKESTEERRQIFWDKIKITRLLQMLVKKKQLKPQLLIHLSESSISSPQFLAWLKPGLRKIGKKASNITFLLPSRMEKTQNTFTFIKLLGSYNCKLALDEFVFTKDSGVLLNKLHPSYIKLSLAWVREIDGDDAKEVQLASLIRLFESKGIRIIAPCGLNKRMRRLFILSGVSFCQERTLKPA